MRLITSRVLAAAIALAFTGAASAQSFDVGVAGQTARHATNGAFDSVTIRVAGPQGYFFERSVRGRSVQLNAAGLTDGEYVYSASFRRDGAPQSATPGGDESEDGRSAQSRPGPLPPIAVDGSFAVRGGVVYLNTGGSQRFDETPKSSLIAKDQVIADDFIAQGSGCFGFDCVNNENFGADTIRLKENNLRIHFEDTSASGSFPTNDWRLVANDQASGGASRFYVEDITGGRVPFSMIAGAPTNSVVIGSSGNVGFGTATPVLDLHVASGNTPAVRFEQDGSGGFTAQTWDIGANEANFFVRDVTAGSRLPFRIFPGAPSSTLTIRQSAGQGQVGINTVSPDAALQVVGDVLVDGSIAQLSSRDAKTDFSAVDQAAVLREVKALPIQTWRYKQDDATLRHLGPVAQDFHAAFGLGDDPTRIAPTDMAGVALAAIQALQAQVEQRDARIEDLERRLAALEQQAR